MNWKSLLLVFLVLDLLSAGEAASEENGNALALTMYRVLAGKTQGNIVYSPYSLEALLAVLGEGADRGTREEIRALLKSAPRDFQATGETLLKSAVGIWVRSDYPILESYLRAGRERFGSTIESIDFRSGEQSARVINQWIAGQTAGKIQALVEPGRLNRDTRLVASSAVYFKGPWSVPFSENLTRLRPFYVEPEQSVEVPTMFCQLMPVPYVRLGQVRLLELPYRDSEFSMILLLPEERGGLPHLESSLDAASVADYLLRLPTQKELEEEREKSYDSVLGESDSVLVNVHLPRFGFESAHDFKPALVFLGMAAAFTDQADFSRITRRPDLKLSFVTQKAFIHVDERGTEAGGASVGGMMLKSMPENVFCADHPFLFLVCHRPTGTILFMGRVADPR
ncbi:MAG: serpin family protein [Armatimonadetes bacterium]|nr:serpin family protein [Armatimonadota bacterium]